MKKNIKKPKIVLVASTDITINAFSKSYKIFFKKYNVIVISNFKNKDFFKNEILESKQFKIVNLPISRGINIFLDFYCLIVLFFQLLKIKPDIIFSCTPKAGLISSICSFLLKIKNIHIFTGQVWVTKTGIQRIILKYFDWLIAKLSNFL